MTDPENGGMNGGLGDSPRPLTSSATQANALLRKNLTYQKRNWRTNCCLVLFPVALCVLLVVIQVATNSVFSGADFKCGCRCVPNPDGAGCTEVCGLQYSNDNQSPWCGVLNPAPWPAVLQVPAQEYVAVLTSFAPEIAQPPSCRTTGTCATTIPYTGSNRTVADSMAGFLLGSGPVVNATNPSSLFSLSQVVLGTSEIPYANQLVEPGFTSRKPISVLRQSCANSRDNTTNFTITAAEGYELSQGFSCYETSLLWRDNSASINSMLYQGYRGEGNSKEIGEYPVAYDFSTTDPAKLDVNIWYNETYANRTEYQPSFIVRVSRSLNMASQAFLRYKLGEAAELPLLFVKEMPKEDSQLRLDFASLLGPTFYMWILGFMFPVVLTALVYEKQYHLRMMMKMQGLGDRAYWVITYLYYLALFCTYMVCFIIFGSIVRLTFFTKNDYSIQVVFYFLYINMIISLAFLVSNFFRNVKTATAFGYIYVFGSGLLGGFFFDNYISAPDTGKSVLTGLEIIPPFATYRGLYEFSAYSFKAVYTNGKGMRWSDLKDEKNDMTTVLIILAVEWVVFMLLNFYLDQVLSSENGIRKHPLFFLNFKRKSKGGPALSSSLSRKFSGRSKSLAHIEAEDQKSKPDRPDVAREREQVKSLALNPSTEYPIVCDNLKRVYPARDGNPPKYAVKGFSLAVPKGECFGILGPNGAGKTSSINMMIGFLKPSSGTAYIQGMNILTEMDRIYSCMGVCPQHDLLWGQLTGREHLLFYGRLKNLKGTELKNAVESSLRSVNLWDNGVADKQCRRYSGGMKRRLSVAISLIGSPQVVYMDEPSTGLDPASRYNLWNVVKESKQDRAIILTTHSMEEAEALCDRLGIFVNGELQCIGNAKELTARYGGLYVLTITTPPEQEAAATALAMSLTPNAKKIYGLSGTQKFELPKTEVSVATVFTAIEHAKQRLEVKAWGLSDTTLEDVFIKIARSVEGGVQLQ